MDTFSKKKYIIFLLALEFAIRGGLGLQGIPTWISLGLKSPFIEFRMETEVLSNTSIALNTTSDENLRKKYGHIDDFPSETVLRTNQTIFYLSDNTSYSKFNVNQLFNQNKVETTTTTIPPTTTTLLTIPVPKSSRRTTYNYDKQIEILEERVEEEIIELEDRRDRKYILPLALKNPTEEPKRSPLFQESTPNIEDLKRHILMLQNLTKNDKTFQSKFVVFPNLQKNQSLPVAVTARPSLNTPVQMALQSKIILRDSYDPIPPSEKITIIPQVILQNDQTPMTPEDYEELKRNKEPSGVRVSYSGRINNNRRNGQKKRKFTTTTTSTTTTTTPTPTPKQKRKKQRNIEKICKRNPNKKICQNSSNLSYQNVQKPQNSSVVNAATAAAATNSSTQQILQRSSRSSSGRDQPKNSQSLYQTPSSKDPSSQNANANESYSVGAYKENIDLNPDLCYEVKGLSHGQQKLCALHTSLMPAISRGARSAIQECKHQFQNRRWNCSTVDDPTVFGPMTVIGSPEMAFVHALAAAGVASFIARACRDGQLASCGCSRSVRPKQLHDDWTWGGCGDDLEFGYKFAQSFIDIREKERKRGTRGLVSVPQNPKIDEKLLGSATNETGGGTGDVGNAAAGNENPNKFKPEDLIELQEKITKEILSTRLQEEEMHDLQAKINREILNSKVFSLDNHGPYDGNQKKTNQRINPNRLRGSGSAKARSLMNLHNNEAGRRAVIKKSRITCKCHGVSGSCSLITCWQQLTSIREIGEYLREKYDEATQVKLNKRGRLQVKDPRYKVPTASDLVYLDESPDWCRNNKQLQWPGTHGRICNKTSSGLDGCSILCCGRGYNTKKLVVKERCNCKFHWCCQVKCETCVKVIEEYTCK